jgi:external thioesterase TEII
MNDVLFYEMKKGTSNKQIIFFPYLGGMVSSFHNLISKLDMDVSIWCANPPGHGNSKRDLVEDIDIVADMYFEELKNIMMPECTYFGHSLGGIVAYYVAHRTMNSKEHAGKLKSLILSACDAPNTMRHKKTSELRDDKLLELIVSYGAMPKEIIQEKSLIEFFLPIFRADYKILESAAAKEPIIPLDVSAFLLWGENDPEQPVNPLPKWLPYLRNGAEVFVIEKGEHLFINSHPAEVSECIRKILYGLQN